ncbi:MAG: hypothetical protein U0132_23310 [Gemmatimonadaceae bacterium]
MRDTVAEMAARAHEISLEAGSKMAAAMKDVIGAAAGLSAFAIESARDLVQFMVRRGQMTQDEADKLLREAEEAHAKNPKPITPKAAEAKKPVEKPAPKPVAPPKPAVPAPAVAAAPAPKPAPTASKPPAPAPAAKVVAKPVAKVAAPAPAKPAAKKVAAPAPAKKPAAAPKKK